MTDAVTHLRRADPVLDGIIGRVGPLARSHEPDLWWALVDAIVSQQLSVRAAATIVSRLAARGADGARPGPAEILGLDETALRACGLSRAKTRAVHDLATRWLDGSLDHAGLAHMDDEAVVAELGRVRGIGRWTAEMILVFHLERPDVLPVGDLGLRNAVQRAYGLPARPGDLELYRLAEPWRPYRSLATRYLWRFLAPPPPGTPPARINT
jgi:DNA-3-methyladenine glycosylase II